MESKHIAAGWIENAEHHVKPTKPQSPIKVQLIDEMVEIVDGKIVAVHGALRLTPYHPEQAKLVSDFMGNEDLKFAYRRDGVKVEGDEDASSKPEAAKNDGNRRTLPRKPVQQKPGRVKDVPPATT